MTGHEEVRLDRTGQPVAVPARAAVEKRVSVAVRPERLEILPAGRAAPEDVEALTTISH